MCVCAACGAGDVLARIPVEMVYALTDQDDTLAVSGTFRPAQAKLIWRKFLHCMMQFLHYVGDICVRLSHTQLRWKTCCPAVSICVPAQVFCK
jgi:hypothetical protein